MQHLLNILYKKSYTCLNFLMLDLLKKGANLRFACKLAFFLIIKSYFLYLGCVERNFATSKDIVRTSK
jgi:hypothetical protein